VAVKHNGSNPPPHTSMVAFKIFCHFG
jgi:hypothetical protein